jgi:hypothetical protein
MYKFVPGDSTNMGFVSYDSVERCMRMVVGLDSPTQSDIMLCDFDSDGRIDLKDTLKVMQIVENNKKGVYMNGDTITIDTEIVKGVLLGLIVKLSDNVTVESLLQSDTWLFESNNNVVYAEAIGNGHRIENVCKIQNESSVYIIGFDAVFELDGVMHYVCE